jgi:hypothetical protein
MKWLRILHSFWRLCIGWIPAAGDHPPREVSGLSTTGKEDDSSYNQPNGKIGTNNNIVIVEKQQQDRCVTALFFFISLNSSQTGFMLDEGYDC